MACFVENLCLYGMPDGQWAVDLPAEEVPPEMPEPSLGYAISSLILLNVVVFQPLARFCAHAAAIVCRINFSRAGMQVSFCILKSDSVSLTFV